MSFTFNNKTYTHTQEGDFLSDTLEEAEGEIADLNFLSNYFNTFTLENYLQYTRGEDFDMNEEVAKTFDFMGVINHNNYPLDYWRCKLLDNKVRERFYKEKIHDEELSGLIDVTEYYSDVALDIITRFSSFLPDGIHIAGGLLASLLTIDFTDELTFKPVTFKELFKNLDSHFPRSDIDLFIVGDNERIEELAELFGEEYTDKGHVIEWRDEGFKTTQLIKRKYRSTSEIVYSFDVDASGLVLIGGRIYSNACGEYAIANKVNHFDAERSGPFYSERLIKYRVKGFDISIPVIDKNKIDFDMISALYMIRSKNIIIHPFAKLVYIMYYKGEIETHYNAKAISAYEAGDRTRIEYSKTLDSITPCKKEFNSISDLLDNEFYGKEFNTQPSPYLNRDLFHHLVETGKDLPKCNDIGWLTDCSIIYRYNNTLYKVYKKRYDQLCRVVGDEDPNNDENTVVICRKEDLEKIREEYFSLQSDKREAANDDRANEIFTFFFALANDYHEDSDSDDSMESDSDSFQSM